MKIRTDFVTNSSSSSFVAMLELGFDNGKNLSVLGASVSGDGETFIVEPEADYRFDNGVSSFAYVLWAAAREDIQKVQYWLDRLFRGLSEATHLYRAEKDELFNNAQNVVSGKLTIQQYTFGEYSYMADPIELLKRYTVCPTLNRRVGQSVEDLLKEMRSYSSSKIYDDNTLRRIAELALEDEYGSETRIIQVLTEDHTLDTIIQNGDGFLETEDVFSHISRIEDNPLGRDSTSRMRAYGLYGIDFHERAKKLKTEFSNAVEFVPKSDLEFKRKRFCFLCFDYGAESREKIVNKLGGECDDLTCEQIDCFVFKGLYKDYLPEFDDKEDMYFEILQRKKNNPSIRILTREVFDACAEEPLKELKQEELRQKVEAKRQREEAQRQREEEKAKLVEELRLRKAAQRRVREEAKQQAAEEKQRLQAERAQAKAEKERLATEARAQREQARQEAAANAVIRYAPGEEPEKLRTRLDTLFKKLDGAYPDKTISGLQKDHKKWAATVTELYRLLGYPDGQTFLEAYGYTVVQNAGGRPSSIDPVAIMEELRHRYPNGGAESMDTLKNDNPDIPWKTLANNAMEYYGATLVAYLKQIGILGKPGNKAIVADSRIDATLEAVNKSEEVKQVSASAETEPSLPVAPAENDEDSWIQAIAAEAPLQDEEVLYLRTIHQLFQFAETVRMIDVAKRLEQGTGKVSYWMKKLREKGILDTTSKGVITMLKP